MVGPDRATGPTVPSGRTRRPTGRPGPRHGFFDRYAVLVARYRWGVIAVWLAIGALVTLTPPPSSDGNELASIIPLDSPAISAELRSVQQFGFPLSSRTVVVQRDPDGLSPFVQAESVLDALAVNQGPKPEWPLLGALPITNSLPLVGVGGERDTSVLTYLFMDPVSSFESQQQAAQRYIAANLERPEDHVVGVAGSVPARAQQARLVAESLPRLELFTVLAIIVLVTMTFRSLVAPLIALAASGLAFLATIRLSQILSSVAGISAPAELEPLLVALLLGIVTDYTIFYVTALQNRLTHGVPGSTPERRGGGTVGAAVRSAIASDTPIIGAAGVTVAAGTAALLAAESEFFRAFGPAMALAVLMGLVVSITLVPALLAVLGRATFWPRRPTPAEAVAAPGGPSSTSGLAAAAPTHAGAPTARPALASGGPGRTSVRAIERLTSRPVAAAVALGTVALLLVASWPLHRLDLGVAFTSSLPPTNAVRVASDAAAAAYAPGITSPTTLLVEQAGVGSEVAELERLQARIEAEPGVAGVLGPAQNVVGRPFDVVVARSGDAARMLIVLDHDPLDATAVDDLAGLAGRLPALAAASGLPDATLSLGGDTALAQGLVGSTEQDLYRIAVAGVVVNLLLLVVFLRALVAPLLLLACSVLALTASLGLTVHLFMDSLGVDGLTFYVPFAAAVLLVSLGSDYNIFGVGRIWDAARHLPLREAIITAVPESSRAITSAGVTLAVSFGMLAFIPLSPFRELGFAMACGIVIDAFVVRSLLVPALLVLVGPVSGWPGPHLAGSRKGRDRWRHR